MEHKNNRDTNGNWYIWNNPQRLEKGIGIVGNRGTNRDHPNSCIVKIDQNTEESPEDLRSLAVTQTLVKGTIS